MGTHSQESMVWTVTIMSSTITIGRKELGENSLAEAARGQIIPLRKARMNGAECTPRNTEEAKI